MMNKKGFLILSVFTLVFLTLAIVSAECIDTCKSNNVYVNPSYQGTVNVCSYDKMGTHYLFGCQQNLTTPHIMEYYNPYQAPSRYFWDIRCNNFNTPWCWVRNHNCGAVSGTAENWNICTSPINDLGSWHNGVNQGTCNSCAAQNQNNAPLISALAANPTNHSAIISWLTDINSSSLVNYGLTSSLGTTLFSPNLTLMHGVILENLQNLTTYYYKVTSCNSQNNCTTLGTFNFVTLANSVPPIDTTPPGIITDFSYTATNSSIDMTWTNPIDTDFNGILMYLDGIQIATLDKTQNSYNINNLAENTTYNITITTIDTSGNTNPSTFIITTAIGNQTNQTDTTPPGKVTNLNAVPALKSIYLTWTNPADSDFNGTMIFVNYMLKATLDKTKTSYNIINLAENTTYNIAVITFDLSGNLNPAMINATTLSGTPAPIHHNKKTTTIISSAPEEEPEQIITYRGQTIGNLTTENITTKKISSINYSLIMLLLSLLILLILILIILALILRR